MVHELCQKECLFVWDIEGIASWLSLHCSDLIWNIRVDGNSNKISKCLGRRPSYVPKIYLADLASNKKRDWDETYRL
jgi:hypothetical protein